MTANKTGVMVTYKRKDDDCEVQRIIFESFEDVSAFSKTLKHMLMKRGMYKKSGVDRGKYRIHTHIVHDLKKSKESNVWQYKISYQADSTAQSENSPEGVGKISELFNENSSPKILVHKRNRNGAEHLQEETNLPK